jgi:large subunit ribosomal protein L25
MVLVREIQRDVIRRNVLHVDFLKVAMDVRITAEVPIELVGRAPAVEELGGVLVTGINSIEVEALPADLRDRVTVDLESLVKIDDSITAGDLFLGEGVELLTDPAELVARVIYQVEEVLEEVVEPEVVPVAAEPELVERGKREEELPEEEQPKP